jgi:trehalose synthase
MVKVVHAEEQAGLEGYASQAYLTEAVRNLTSVASTVAPLLRGRKVWMVNSTAQGGGVAEMLPKIIRLMSDLGLQAKWAVLETSRKEFFVLTKRIHNLLHGVGDPRLGPEDRALYDAVSWETADALRSHVAPNDLLIVHDPQPLGAGAILKKELGLATVWRCHVGLDEDTPATAAAWEFLRPYAVAYDRAIFTSPEYVPHYLAKRSSIMTPGIDPAGWKNRELSQHKLVGILVNSGLLRAVHPVLTPPWDHPALRLGADGTFAPSDSVHDVGFGYRPTVLQVSRWDRLKGWLPLLRGFARLKHRAGQVDPGKDARHRRRLEIVRLVLAGPDPSSIQDDPKATEVLEELRAEYLGLSPELQADVAILALPMASRKENALMVNVLQRCASLVVQNSLQEGFGLTAAEAMWKRAPVLGTRACGLRIQIRDGLEGRINAEPENPEAIAAVMDEMLRARDARERWGSAAQRRVYDEFLIFAQVRRWLEVFASCAERAERLRRGRARTELRRKLGEGPEVA